MNIESLIRAAHEALAVRGIQMGPAKVTRLVRTYVREHRPRGIAFSSYFASQIGVRPTEVRFFRNEFGVVDPVGESVAYRVDRERRSA